MINPTLLRVTRHRLRFMQGTKTQSLSIVLPRQVYVCVPAIRSFSNLNRFNSSTRSPSVPASRRPYSSSNMSLEIRRISPGNGTDYPKEGDQVTMEYTGWLSDGNSDNGRGKEFDSSVGRGDFKTRIGVGQVIKGWDEGVPKLSLGEKAVLTIPGHMAYGTRGYPGLIPPNATLIFEVKLKGINGKSA